MYMKHSRIVRKAKKKLQRHNNIIYTYVLTCIYIYNIHRTSKNFVVFFCGGRIVKMYTYIIHVRYTGQLSSLQILYIHNIIINIVGMSFIIIRFKYARARVSPVALTCTECVGRITWMASPLYVGTVYTMHTHTHTHILDSYNTKNLRSSFFIIIISSSVSCRAPKNRSSA